MTLHPESFDLTLEQQFEMQRMRRAAETMSREQACDLLLKATKLLMVKENIIRSLVKDNEPGISVGTIGAGFRVRKTGEPGTGQDDLLNPG